MDEQERLLKRIRVCSFVLLETGLYLDTHPEDQLALDHYRKYQLLERAAYDEYVDKFGPLTKNDFSGGKRWNWVDGPWPWEEV